MAAYRCDGVAVSAVTAVAEHGKHRRRRVYHFRGKSEGERASDRAGNAVT